MVSLEVCTPNSVGVGFRNMLSSICNYIIREVEAIYSNKSSRICSDRYTSEGILLNGLISLSFISSRSPHVQMLVSFFWFLGICLGRRFAFPCLAVLPWLEPQPLLSTAWVALGCWSFGSSRHLPCASTPQKRASALCSV